MIQFKNTSLEGCFLVDPFHHSDNRGEFIKIYNSEAYSDLDFRIDEIYYSSSAENVFRGFHFQLPPADHAKIVFCLSGEVTDYVLDIRKSSKTYGQVEKFSLDGVNKKGVYIPRGFAHGFYSHKDNSTLAYLVETCYKSQYDSGLLWSSVVNDLPQSPRISDRDSSFLGINEFRSPF